VNACACLHLETTTAARVSVSHESDQKIPLTRRFFTLFTIQRLAQMLPAAIFSEHPWTIAHRRLVADMLSMTAGQIGHPIALFVLVVSNDRLLHGDKGSCSERRKWPLRTHLGREECPVTRYISIE